eukprot:m.262114 g.262114  ORF g.262114 m.262114 type:complete len:399 (+) comp44436_c0_seq1:218-1414(+)
MLPFKFALGLVVLEKVFSFGNGCVNLVDDCGAHGNGKGDDTQAFIKCQELASRNDGCIVVPAGQFPCLAVPINTSNVVWRMDSGAVFVPRSGMTKCDSVFYMGAQGSTDLGTFTNISFLGPIGEAFTIDISKPQLQPWNVRGIIILGGISHFTFANAVIKMADPVVDPTVSIEAAKSGIEFNNAGGLRRLNPKFGLIANLTTTGGTFGYGAIQAQSVEDTHFENLDGTGGVTLRMETGVGYPGAFVGNITAKNIICRNGKNAVMVLPHQQQNGRFTMENVKSYSCLTTVDIGSGYVDPYRHPGVPAGRYSNDSSIVGVLGVYGTSAQVEVNISNYASCAPCDFGWPPTGSKWGNFTAVNYNVTVHAIVATGYPAPSNRTTCVHWARYKNGKEQFCSYQ